MQSDGVAIQASRVASTCDQAPLVNTGSKDVMLGVDIATTLIELAKTDDVCGRPQDEVHPCKYEVLIGLAVLPSNNIMLDPSIPTFKPSSNFMVMWFVVSMSMKASR